MNIGIIAYLMLYIRGKHKRCHTLYRYLLFCALIRFALEYLRRDLTRGIYNDLYTSQWIQRSVDAVEMD